MMEHSHNQEVKIPVEIERNKMESLTVEHHRHNEHKDVLMFIVFVRWHQQSSTTRLTHF